MSTFTQGEQMVPVLSLLTTQAAVPGNKDFGQSEVTQSWTVIMLILRLRAGRSV